MPVTTRSEYGLRALIRLAEQRGGGVLSAARIAREEGVPLKYLERILAELRRAGLVTSQAGARGGYRLARAPEAITAGEVVRALDGSLAPMECVHGEVCASQASCRLRPLWVRLDAAMRAVLDEASLAALAAGEAPAGGGPATAG